MASLTTSLSITRPAEVEVTVVLTEDEVRISYDDPKHLSRQIRQNVVLRLTPTGAVDPPEASEMNLSAGRPSDKE